MTTRRRFLASVPVLSAAGIGHAQAPHRGPAEAIVRTGLDVVAAGGGGTVGEALRGERVGLLAHRASATRDGVHAIEALTKAGIRVTRVFAPEHGLRGQAAAGEAVASGTDAATGVPIVSLYGAKRAPEPADLADLDVLVADVQDVGVRFYTYLATVGLALEAAGQVKLRCVVLDRPNPLGGDRVEGPITDSVTKKSLLSRSPGPLVHGLTPGEMARLVVSSMRAAPPLDVVRVDGWKRSMVWSHTGLPFVAPSPNLRSAEAVYAYAGTCLLESTNVTEGRGTNAPFLLIGAPWLDAEGLVKDVRVPGFSFEPLRFTPTASPAAPTPKHRDTECRGVRVKVDTPESGSPYRLGIELLVWLRRRHPKELEWRDGGAALDRLTGTTKVRERLMADLSPEAIVAADAADIEAYRQSRRSVLLY